MMSEATLSLLLLACPVGMGLMMWFMMRGGSGQQNSSSSTGQQKSGLSAEQSAEVTRLRAEVDQLRAEQRNRQRSTDHSS